MPRYKVTYRTTVLSVVEADNPYQAAIECAKANASVIDVLSVAPAVGRPAGTTAAAAAKTSATKKVRRQVSPEARAKLAQNLVKARAARAKKAKATKKAARAAVKK